MASTQAERTRESSIELGRKDEPLTADQLLLQAQGHTEEMPRQFSLFSILGLAFSITNSWIAIFATFQQPLNAGGGPGVFYALLVASVACFLISECQRPKKSIPRTCLLISSVYTAIGLAELSSAFPTCGGQYHFAFMLSTKKTRAFAAFFTGWLSIVAWILCTAASAIYAGENHGLCLRYKSADPITNSPDVRLFGDCLLR